MPTPPNNNLLLAGLPAGDYQRIVSELRPEELPQGRTLLPPAGRMDRFYFVVSGLVSLLYTNSDGQSAEISIVGREGGIGLEHVLGGKPFPADAVVQAPCTAWSLRADVLQQEFNRGGALQRNLLRLTQAMMAQMAHTAICNRHHSVQLQLCRWILLSLDRLRGENLEMTQETIAHMLGVRRAGVNEATGALERDGLVEHTRGRIRVLDREGLESRACECYRVIRGEYERLERELLGDERAADALQ